MEQLAKFRLCRIMLINLRVSTSHLGSYYNTDSNSNGQKGAQGSPVLLLVLWAHGTHFGYQGLRQP